MTDLLELTAQLVAIPSQSRAEGPLAELIEAQLRGAPWLAVTRVGDNVVARTMLGRASRLILAGHTDTVPASRNGEPRIEGERLYGLGAADMKGGLAVMLELARTVADPAIDVTYVFYAREEVDAIESGLLELWDARPDLLVADAAILGEPTSARVEAGCQGTLRLRVTLVGERAHAARPWMGRNAIHRMGALISAIDDAEMRRPSVGGCEFRESLQAVGLRAGVAGNVVPDRAEIVLSHRFAPDRTSEEAESYVRELLAPCIEPGDAIEVVDAAPAAIPALDEALIAALVARNGLEVSAKLGWTDVARFASHGIPAVNFGPGGSEVAHTAGEHVDRGDLVAVYDALTGLLAVGA